MDQNNQNNTTQPNSPPQNPQPRHDELGANGLKAVANGQEYSPTPVIVTKADTEPISAKSYGMHLILKILLIISPLPVSILCGILSNSTSSSPGSMGIGVALIGIGIFGIPFVAITGLIVSLLVRKKASAGKWSTYGYLVPAMFIWFMAASVIFE